MNETIIARAGEVIASKAEYVGGGMEGYAVLALTDENGSPTASALTIAKADGINWLTFATSPDSNKAKRVELCNRASVCIASSAYNITLVGTVEIVADAAVKKDSWFAPMAGMWSGPDDPSFCVLRFHTERYNLFFADDESEAVGTLKNTEAKPLLKVTPGLGFRGQCNQAMALYQKAFGGTIITKILYSEADPADFQCKEAEKEFVFYAEMVIGNHLISLGDDSEGVLDETTGGNASAISLLIEFETIEELKAAYEILSDGATIITPMSTDGTMYCTGYVSLVDQFGIHWDLMSGYAEG
ncbi:MAG: pyridoxamine 5'-phosphate oxidase family protein [Oscillospiraceae bacterium]|nr:pyridoxamine 5'-phosphate oxidase family protein [Oscillospiraceae bacterium]